MIRAVFTMALAFCLGHSVNAGQEAPGGGSPHETMINVLTKGADPTGREDSSASIQKAVDEACGKGGSQAGGAVYLPAGSYKLTRTININCSDITISGVGKGVTTLFPTNQTDIFFADNTTGQPHLYRVNFRDLQIYRTDNPTGGAGIHFRKVAGATVDHVAVAGQFIGIEIESSIGLFFNDVDPGGDDSAPGSRLWWIHRAGPKDENPSENFVTNTNSRSLHRGSYTYGIFMQDSDGFYMSNYHVGFTSGPALYVKAQYADDVIFGLTFANGGFDEAQYCVYSTMLEGQKGTKESWNFNGMLCELSELDGFYNDDEHLVAVTAVGAQFFLNGRHAVNLLAGSSFKFGQSIFRANNYLGKGGSHVVLAGKVADVNLDGASFLRGNGPHPADYDVLIGEGADRISLMSASCTGASKGELNISPSSAGRHITPSTLCSDRAP